MSVCTGRKNGCTACQIRLKWVTYNFFVPLIQPAQLQFDFENLSAYECFLLNLQPFLHRPIFAQCTRVPRLPLRHTALSSFNFVRFIRSAAQLNCVNECWLIKTIDMGSQATCIGLDLGYWLRPNGKWELSVRQRGRERVGGVGAHCVWNRFHCCREVAANSHVVRQINWNRSTNQPISVIWQSSAKLG